MQPNIILTLMGSGLFFLLLGAIASTVWRKKEFSLSDLFCVGSAAAAYPEKYVREDRIKVVKTLHFTGVTLFLTGVLVVVGYSIWK
jgi:hypothetical protein